MSIGFAGAGVIAWAHAIGLQAMTKAGVVDVRVTVVHDADEGRAEGFAALNGAVAVPDVVRVLEHCDAVWVCTPTAAHRKVVEDAAAHGCAVFCEKPLGRNFEEARAVAAAATGAGIPAQVGLVLRHSPVFLALRDLIASGELGTVMSAVLRDDQYFPVQGLYNSTWRGDVEVAGGGCLLEHSIHDVDILRFCLGEIADVSARTANFEGRAGIEDLAAVSLSFESGAIGQVVSVWHGILSRGSTRRLEVFCRHGLVWLEDDFVGPLHIQTDGGRETRPCPPPAWVRDLPLGDDEIAVAVRSYVEADRAFLDAVTRGDPPAPSMTEALIAHELVDAAYRSAASGGSPVSLR